jgi:hypothetical protein
MSFGRRLSIGFKFAEFQRVDTHNHTEKEERESETDR